MPLWHRTAAVIFSGILHIHVTLPYDIAQMAHHTEACLSGQSFPSILYPFIVPQEKQKGTSLVRPRAQNSAWSVQRWWLM